MIQHEMLILAPVERLWALTLDVEHWPALSPSMTAVERLDDGPLLPGSRARIKQPAQRPRIWTVRRVINPSLFEWDAPFGWMRIIARHHLQAGSGGTLHRLEVEFSGPGSTGVEALLRRPIARALAAENAGFKRAAEAP